MKVAPGGSPTAGSRGGGSSEVAASPALESHGGGSNEVATVRDEEESATSDAGENEVGFLCRSSFFPPPDLTAAGVVHMAFNVPRVARRLSPVCRRTGRRR